jgi:hypothetical protein
VHLVAYLIVGKICTVAYICSIRQAKENAADASPLLPSERVNIVERELLLISRKPVLDLHLSQYQGLAIETPSGDVEVSVVEVRPEAGEATLEIDVPEEWKGAPISPATFKLHEELSIGAPDGSIRLKVLRFRPRPDGTGGSVSLGIDAPRSWPILR